MVLSGDANDFVAKGLSGGKVVLSPPKTSKVFPLSLLFPFLFPTHSFLSLGLYPS